MTYLSEFRENRRVLAAVCLGMATGFLLSNYVTHIFVPHLLSTFGWSKAQFSAIGLAALLSIICAPLAGRLNDVFGVRQVAAIGVIVNPLTYIGFSAMTGDFSQYFWISFFQMNVVAQTTGGLVYGRLIAQYMDRARGLALSIAGCMPAVAGAIIAPFLSMFVDTHGWRAGYVAVAIGTALGGVGALLLIPKAREDVPKAVTTRPPKATRDDYREILQSPAFRILMISALLCNLPYIVQTTQLVVVLVDRGLTATTAAFMVSVFGVSAMVSRLASGVMLDRFTPQFVAAAFLGLPGIGLLILASGASSPALLVAAVALLGLSMGAETNIFAYLAMKFFRTEIFSTAFGLIAASLSISFSVGSGLLGLTLKLTGSFTMFLSLAVVAAVVGSGLLLLLGRPSVRAQEPKPA